MYCLLTRCSLEATICFGSVHWPSSGRKFYPSNYTMYNVIQGVPLFTETGISLIILPLMRTHTTDPLYRHTLQTHTTDTYYIIDTHYRHKLQTHTTDTHYRHTLQTHSSPFLTQRTYSCSNFVAISSLVLELLKKCWVR